jgi:hypothetical protein
MAVFDSSIHHSSSRSAASWASGHAGSRLSSSDPITVILDSQKANGQFISE